MVIPADMPTGSCVFSCSHPLWGGEGTCITTDDAVEDSCACDPGYASRDSFGHPSCVPRKVQFANRTRQVVHAESPGHMALVAVYTVVAVATATGLLFSLWHLAQFRKLSSTARSTRRAVARLRLVIATSVTHGGSTLVFCTAAARGGEASLWDSGMFYVSYIMSFSPLMVSGACLGELWLESIPPQLVTPGGVLEKFKEMVVEWKLLVWGGFAGMGGVSFLALSALYFDMDTIRTTINLIMLGACVPLAIAFPSVAVFLTRAIDSAASKGAQAWHGRARRTIRRQGVAMLLATVACSFALVVLELTRAGRSTPIIPYAVTVLVGGSCINAAIHFTKPTGLGRTAVTSPRSLDQPTVRSRLGSALRSATSSVLPPKRAAVTVVSGCDDKLGATEARPLRQKVEARGHCSPIAVGYRTGGKGKKVIPVTAGIV